MGILFDFLRMKIDEISSLTNYDYFKVRSSFWSQTEKRVNCFECKKRKDHEKIKIIQGCNTDKDVVVFPTDDFKFYGCIGKHSDANFNGYKRIYDFFKIGVNPYGGNLLDIPNKVIEIGILIDNLTEEKIREDNGKRSTN